MSAELSTTRTVYHLATLCGIALHYSAVVTIGRYKRLESVIGTKPLTYAGDDIVSQKLHTQRTIPHHRSTYIIKGLYSL